jgi:peptide/nickel transport system substrate-binding protein
MSQWRPKYGARRISRRNVIRGGAVAAGALALGACAGPAAPPPPAATATYGEAAPVATAPPQLTPTVAAFKSNNPTASDKAPKYGGVYKMAINGKYPHRDPHQTTAAQLFGLGAGMAWSRLLKLKLKGVELPAYVPEPDTVDSWQQADDLTFIFKLKPGIKFHNIAPVNGRELVADDVVFSYTRQLTTGFANRDLLAGVSKIEAPVKYTVKITRDSPEADFLINLADGRNVLIAKEQLGGASDLKEAPIIGTGPWIAEKADVNEGDILVRNPDYFRIGLPYLDRIEKVIQPDQAAQLAAFRSGQSLRYEQATPEDIAAAKASVPGALVERFRAIGSTSEVAFRMDVPPFNDVRVRQAAYYALDRQVFIDTVWSTGWHTVGFAVPELSWLVPESEVRNAYNPNGKADPSKARQLLAQAGFANGLEIELQVANYNQTYRAGGELIAAMLKEAGITTKIQIIDTTQYATATRVRGEFAHMYYGAGLGSNGASSVLFQRYHSKGTANATKLKDPKLDEMIEQQAVLVRDPEARKKLLLDIQRHILQNAYFMAIHTYEPVFLHAPYVRDFYSGQGGLGYELDRYSIVWFDR